jgi:hypothetical protein
MPGCPPLAFPLPATRPLGRRSLYRRRDERFLRVPDEVLVDRVRVYGAEGADALAQILGPPEEGPVPPVVRFLLKEYMEEVDGTLAMNFRSGSWTGSEVSYLEPKIEVARSWLVRDWRSGRQHPRPAGAAARRAERPTRESGTIRPDPGQGGAPAAASRPPGRPRPPALAARRNELDAGARRAGSYFPPGEGVGRTRPGAGPRQRRGRFRPRTVPVALFPRCNSERFS